MAEVKMDLAELKAMESQIEQLKKDKQNLIDSQQQVVIYHKHFDGKIRLGDKDLFSKNKVDVQSIRWNDQFAYSHRPEVFHDHNVNFNDLIERGLITIDLTENTSKSTKDYKNMSEVIDEIRQEEESKVKDLLVKTLNRATEAEYNINVIEDKYKKLILADKESFNERLIKLNQDFDEEKETLKISLNSIILNKNEEITKLKQEIIDIKQEFNDFKEDKKRLTLEEQINELKRIVIEKTNELESLKNKTFLQKLFDK